MQLSHAVLPAIECLPEGQVPVHACVPEPTTPNRPAGQREQTAAPFAAKRPAPQGTQLPVAANWPAVQAWQLALPPGAENLPAILSRPCVVCGVHGRPPAADGEEEQQM